MIVIKYGGHAMTSEELQASFAADVAALHRAGKQPVVVHGGGPQISAMLDRMGIPSEFRGGLRVTTPEAMELVRMVMLSIGKDLATRVQSYGVKAVGLSGEDGGLITAEPMPELGQVGDAGEVDPALLHTLVEAGYVPVVSTCAPDASGVPHNLNADIAAAAVAIALKADRLTVLTDVPGVYANWPDTSSLLSSLTAAELEELLPRLSAGMVPKMQACLRAVQGGVPTAQVVDGRVPHAVLDSHGTVVTP